MAKTLPACTGTDLLRQLKSQVAQGGGLEHRVSVIAFIINLSLFCPLRVSLGGSAEPMMCPQLTLSLYSGVGSVLSALCGNNSQARTESQSCSTAGLG